EMGGDGGGGDGDLVEDDVLDRRPLEALLPRRPERVVEIRADRPRGAGGGERVAAAAALREELLAGLHVRALGHRLAAGAATGEEKGYREKEEGALQAGGALPIVPSFATASSRVG